MVIVKLVDAVSTRLCDGALQMPWLPPGRGLYVQRTEDVYERGSRALSNCLGGETKLFTQEFGSRSLEALGKADVTCWTSQGWRKGTVRSFGVQDLNTITFKPCVKTSTRSKTHHRVRARATSTHGWKLSTGEKTYDLHVGDLVASEGIAQLPENPDGLRHGYIPTTVIV
jgi:hypothetical protein